MEKAGTNAGMDWCRTRLGIQAGIQARSLTKACAVLHLPRPSPIYRVGAILTLIMVTNIIREIWRPKVRKYVPPHVNIFCCQIISFTTNAIPASGPELLRNSMLGSDCGNVICYSIGAYTVGTCSPRVCHVHPVRRSLKQPNASGRSCATPLLPGNPSGLCFYLSRLWNRSVFSVLVQVTNLSDGCTCQRADIFLWRYLA